jgi:hypothetical protein
MPHVVRRRAVRLEANSVTREALWTPHTAEITWKCNLGGQRSPMLINLSADHAFLPLFRDTIHAYHNKGELRVRVLMQGKGESEMQGIGQTSTQTRHIGKYYVWLGLRWDAPIA